DAAYRVGKGESLIAHGDERDPAGEGVHAVIAADARGERVVGGQHHAGVGVGDGEGHGALIVGVDVAVEVQGPDRDVEGRARDSGRRGRNLEAVAWRALDLQCDFTGAAQSRQEGFLSGAVEIGPSDVSEVKFGPIYFAAGKIESEAWNPSP